MKTKPCQKKPSAITCYALISVRFTIYLISNQQIVSKNIYKTASIIGMTPDIVPVEEVVVAYREMPLIIALETIKNMPAMLYF